MKCSFVRASATSSDHSEGTEVTTSGDAAPLGWSRMRICPATVCRSIRMRGWTEFLRADTHDGHSALCFWFVPRVSAFSLDRARADTHTMPTTLKSSSILNSVVLFPCSPRSRATADLPCTHGTHSRIKS